MQTTLRRFLSITLSLSFTLLVVATRADQEQDLIAILKSDAKPVAKCEACKQLRLSGTVNSVPALAPLLPDERVGQAARYALEAIPGAEADAALREALAAASPTLKVGIVDSLGWRRDAAAVPLIVPLVASTDAAIASSAATALGRIGGAPALDGLKSARSTTAGAVHAAVVEGLLRHADRLLQAGDRTVAAALYESLLDPAETDLVRMAAYTGMMRSANDGGLALIVKALEGDDAVLQKAAMRVAGEIKGPETTSALLALLPKSAAPMQIALIAALQSHRDATALPAIASLARSDDGGVRMAAVTALGSLGDATVVPVLVQAAAAGDPGIQGAGRLALVRLVRTPAVTEALVGQITAVPASVQVEAVRALTARAETTAVPALLQLARAEGSAGRKAALLALGSLADGSQVQSLVDLLVEAKTDAARDEVRRVFEALVQRAGDAGTLDVEPLLRGMNVGEVATRQALLQVSALFVDARLREGLRAAAKDQDERIRLAAARALCDARDVSLLPDVLVVARQASEPGLRTLAIDGAVRLATEEGGALSTPQRTEALTAAYGLAQRVEDKRLLLAGLARVPSRDTLKLAEQSCGDASVKAEAEQASLQIAERLGAAEFMAVEAALTRLSKDAGSAAVQGRARALLKVFNSGWLCAGPYRQAGKEAQALFDVAFPPEQAGGQAVKWQRAPGTTDLARVGEVDFAGVVGGDHAVMYAKTRIFVPQAQPVVFAIGSDDGVKLWVNGELVHANNAVRGLTPDQDQPKGRLREGWNDLFLKITQHTLGCGFTFRVRSENGQEIPGLRLDASGQP